MNSQLRTGRVSCLVVAATVAVVGSLLVAKPARTQTGPVWSYYDVNGHPYGGLRDPNTGLVWGFDTLNDWGTYSGTSSSWSFAEALDTSWPCCATNFTDFCTYEEVANCFWSRNDSDWRLPTEAELVAAVKNGVFHNLDVSPDTGFQGVYEDQPQYGPVYSPPYCLWTSTPGKNRRTQAYAVEIFSGTPVVLSQGSYISYVPVRGPVNP